MRLFRKVGVVHAAPSHITGTSRSWVCRITFNLLNRQQEHSKAEARRAALAAAAVVFVIAALSFQIVTAARTRAIEQTAAQARPEFEVTDVHVSPPEERRGVSHAEEAAFSAGRYEIRNATMLDLIKTAYSVEEAAVFGGPSWLAWDRFDVIAKPPAKTTIAAANVMLQSVLADRFKLVVRKDTKPLPAWVLSAGVGKPKLKPADNAAESACRVVDSNQRLTCTNVTMDAFVAWLRAGRVTTLPVVNSTMIEGSWDFDLHYTVAQGMFGVSENNPIIDALEKEVGLKLELQNVPQAVLIVEGANRNPTANAPGLEKSLPQVRTAFEVASIRPCKAFAPGPEPASGQVNTGCVPLSNLVTLAANLFTQVQVAPNMFLTLPDSEIAGAPKWMNSTFFNIVAKAPVGFDFRAPNGAANYRTMMRNLLVDRFKMVTHYEGRLVDVYTLVAAKPKLKKADPSTRTECRSNGMAPGVPTVIKCQNVTMAQFAEELNRQQPIVASRRRVVDSTSIEGSWDLTFSYRIVPGRGGAGEATDPAGGVSLFDAIEQQLGLKLEGAKRSMPVFVIDSIEETPTEN